MKKNKITFVPTHLGLEEIDMCVPKQSKHYIPNQFKKMPIDIPATNTKLLPFDRTAKACPSFTEIFNEGFVLPAHADMHFKLNENEHVWTISNNDFELSGHPNYQYVEYLDNDMIKATFKIPYPWLCIVPKGYSIRQVPMLYHHNTDWHIAYGTYRGDQIADIHLQVMITSDSDEVLIRQGEPLCYLIPFKRERFDIDIKPMNDKYKKVLAVSKLKQRGAFKGAYLKNTNE